MRRAVAAAVAVATGALVACGGAADATPGFTPRVTNAYFPLLPGMRWEYRGMKGSRHMRDVVTVSSRVEKVSGVPCAVVIDHAYLDGRLAESTIDWYTQDRHGTVWYYGEATKELDRRGHVTSTAGSWRDGVKGATAGIFMPARPRVGQTFQQEHYAGHAEDRFKVVSLRATVSAPYGTFRARALMTEEWTPLEPGVRDGKWYVRGIGVVREAEIKGGDERAELVSFRRR
jgi:hypothetical protein